ncbi:PEP/pyruvate-binding domain-containing protein [Micromonospora mangrovi]|uniref:PEP/pyruvate-binding domain-containing protein n=2 Tax=Micromonospora TaxID=1873 RepID=A0AAU8HE86_9ACTN
MHMVDNSALLVDDESVLVAEPALFGRKFTRQIELAAAGFRVPPLACVPATVFDRAVAPVLGDPALPTGPPDVRAEELRKRVLAGGVPDELRRVLDERFDAIAGPDGLVAVRACVVPDATDPDSGEDSAQDPFAGLSDSFLYVRREELPERVAACWASAFNPEAVLYRAHKNIDPFAARVAVAVQRMVCGERSFVVFTRDPLNGSDRRVIAAAYGIGEGVVQEKADVDHFFVDPATGVVEAHVAAKSRAVGRDPANPAAGPVPVEVPPELAERPVLDDPQAREIATLAGAIAEHFGAPQDIEGTITADGVVHVVQARPIVIPTVAAPVAQILWDNNNTTETFPGVSCALTYSVGRELMEVGFTDLYRRMGVPEETIRHNRPRLRQMIGYLDGHVYYAIDNWYHLHGMMRCFRPLWSTWEQAVGLAGRHDERTPPNLAQTIVHLGEIGLRMAAHPRRVRDFLRWWDERHATLDVADLTPSEVVATYRRLWTEVGEWWGVTLVNGVFLFAATWAANGLLRRWAPEADRAVLNGLLSGGKMNKSALAVQSAVDLAARAAAVPELRAALLADTDARELWDELVAGRYGDDFAEALRTHLREYGDRALQDNKMEAITPREQPWTVLHSVRAYLRQGQDVERSLSAGRDAAQQARRELRRHLRDPARRALVRGAFGTMRTFLRLREDMRFRRSQLMGDLRALLLRQGDHLVTAGRLDTRRDVLDLTVEEVLGAFDGTAPTADLRGMAAVRAAERAAWTAAELTLPARFATDADRPVTDALATVAPASVAGPDGEAVLRGLASSSGIARGRAMVVLDPSVTADETRDRILVARETDPGWLFLMMSAKALVVERGTLLSHTAVTGRLLGIPTVVAVPGATTLIPDGCEIEVDGAAGTVRILGSAG